MPAFRKLTTEEAETLRSEGKPVEWAEGVGYYISDAQAAAEFAEALAKQGRPNTYSRYDFMAALEKEHTNATKKFPDNVLGTVALGEEFGELCEALLKHRAGLLDPYLPKWEKLPEEARKELLKIGVGDQVYALIREITARKHTIEDVRAEAVQVATMAMRIALEGDRAITESNYKEPAKI